MFIVQCYTYTTGDVRVAMKSRYSSPESSKRLAFFGVRTQLPIISRSSARISSQATAAGLTDVFYGRRPCNTTPIPTQYIVFVYMYLLFVCVTVNMCQSAFRSNGQSWSSQLKDNSKHTKCTRAYSVNINWSVAMPGVWQHRSTSGYTAQPAVDNLQTGDWTTNAKSACWRWINAHCDCIAIKCPSNAVTTAHSSCTHV